MAEIKQDVHIFLDEEEALEAGSIALDDYLTANYGDRTFLVSEDGKFLFITEEGSSFLIQEYFE